MAQFPTLPQIVQMMAKQSSLSHFLKRALFETTNSILKETRCNDQSQQRIFIAKTEKYLAK